MDRLHGNVYTIDGFCVEYLLFGYIREIEKIIRITDSQFFVIPDSIIYVCLLYHSSTEPFRTLNAHQQYTKICNALKDLKEYNVQFSVPEFVFIGFQSSGKTSAISLATKLALGTIGHHISSRCPVRFKLITNPKRRYPLIKVNGEICQNEADITNKILQITDTYYQKNIYTFSKDIIEVRIESSQIPELTFVDLPPLIKGDNQQFATAKKCSNELTAFFLHETNVDGTYKYMPIMVKETIDVEWDSHFEVCYIDNLVETYEHGRKKRINWRDDTLFIVNKFDKQINRSPASSLIEYMNYCCTYGETVLTIMNANNENTSNMSQGELNIFVDAVVSKEEERWNDIINEFNKLDDENILELKQLHQSICGVIKMNEILSQKMCDIVKRILPSIERELDKAEHLKRLEIANIMKQIEMCDPPKLKQQCIEFNNKFLKVSKQFYCGQYIMKVNSKYKKTWCKELDDFHVMAHNTKYTSNPWKYEIQSNKLQTLLSKLGNKDIPSLLLKRLRMELLASSAINRIIDAWQCMVGYMTFPEYTNEDIVNICGGFMSTRQPDLWNSIRNIVLDASKHLCDSIIFIAEMFRYKLKENADIIFELTLIEQFGNINALNKENNKIIQLFQRSLRDYKKQIDQIIDKFMKLAGNTPIDRSRILDKFECEETINIGKLIYKMLNPKNKNKFNQEPPKYIRAMTMRGNNNGQSNGYAPPPPPGQPPTHQKNRSGSRSPELTQSSTNLVGQKRDKKDKREERKDSESPKSENKIEMKFQQQYDELFYNVLYGSKTNFPVEYSSYEYDIPLIRHMSYVFWSTIKQQIIRDVIQKVSHLIMAPVKQHDEIVANAIQCGVDQAEVQLIMDKLVKKTGVDVLALKKLIDSKSTIQIPKSVNDLDNNELAKIYGINREQLLKQKVKKIKDLKEFKKLKAKKKLKKMRQRRKHKKKKKRKKYESSSDSSSDSDSDSESSSSSPSSDSDSSDYRRRKRRKHKRSKDKKYESKRKDKHKKRKRKNSKYRKDSSSDSSSESSRSRSRSRSRSGNKKRHSKK
eukprot:544106_1